jgi:hypothetical protein
MRPPQGRGLPASFQREVRGLFQPLPEVGMDGGLVVVTL